MGKKKHFRKRPQNKNGTRGEGYDDIVRENADFETYYKAQQIVPAEEWDSFMATLRENLPSSFRITNYKGEAKSLLDIFKKTYYADLIKRTEDVKEKPFCLPWYPNELGWQLNVTRTSIRKCEAYVKLHNFLISETESGYINRQETVSMLPPLLLDVQPHHKVLDMCAAPGSKTAQLIEMLHSGDAAVPDGFIVANDVDNKRCYMLVHQLKRLQSPCFIISNHDATMMPNIRLPGGKVLKYDRILCDAPCGGDGTIRKNFDVWKKWNAGNSNYLHSLQVRIARRGLELLAVGGKMVYSTCSMNPIEDEAVVHHLLDECKGAVELVAVRDKLPGLVTAPGLSYWKVMSKELQVFESLDQVPDKYRTQVKDYLFPPTKEDAAKYNLDRCFRVLPHQQNTGGFFVAVLQKVSLLPWEKPVPEDPLPPDESKVAAAADLPLTGTLPDISGVTQGQPSVSDSPQINSRNERTRPPPRKRLHRGFKEDPFVFFEDDEAVWPEIRDTYKIDSSFDPKQLMARCVVGKKRNIYLVSKAVKDVLTENEDRIKVINTGVKVFCRSDNRDTTCAFRLTHEGISTMLPYIHNRIVSITRADLVNLLTNVIPVNNSMSMDTRGQLCELVGGSIALVYNEEKENCPPLQIALVGWKGKTSVRAYIPKNEKVHFLRLVGVDTTMFEHNKFNFKPGYSRGKDGEKKGRNEQDRAKTGKQEQLNVENEESDGEMKSMKKEDVDDDAMDTAKVQENTLGEPVGEINSVKKEDVDVDAMDTAKVQENTLGEPVNKSAEIKCEAGSNVDS